MGVLRMGCVSAEEKLQVDILFLGDSLIAQCRDETSVPALVGEALDLTTANGAFGGTTLCGQNRSQQDAYYKDALTFAPLAEAAAWQDFGVQQTVRSRELMTDYFEDTVDLLDSIDYDALKVLVVELGTNDYFAGAPIENEDYPGDLFTVKGALRRGLTVLREKYPELRIIVMSPTYNWYLNTQEDCENKDFGGGYLEAYADGIREAAEECGVEYIDLYHDFYPHETFQQNSLYTEDGVHPNEEGRALIAGTLAAYLQESPVPNR